MSRKIRFLMIGNNAYLSGSGIPRNAAEAVRWWRKAAEQGNADGEASLGQAYYVGIGMKTDEAQGVKLLRGAAEKGSPIAITFLKSQKIPFRVTVDK